MNSSNKEKAILRYLLNKSIDGQIIPSEISQLNTLLENYPDLEHHYVDSILLQFLLSEAQVTTNPDLTVDSVLSNESLVEFAQYEKTAPAVDVPKEEKSQQDLVQKVIYPPREKRKVSKSNIVLLAINAAAILFFVLFLRFAPPKGGIEVATLTGSLNAKWADANLSMQRGKRLCTDKTSLLLREGLVELTFDNHARVTIEGPAEFQILDNDMMKLNYGQLYSQVPAEAYGFQICAQHAKVIDLGTEFGVKEEFDGDTEVHVLKGRVNLISNVLGKKINTNLLAGSARELNIETGELKEITCKENVFARQIESGMNIIWRGQESIDLADIVGGGNGLGTGALGSGIDAASGTYTTTPTRVDFTQVQCHYNPVRNNPFIDGVFVPDGDGKPVILNSNSQSYTEFPVTNGIYRSPITNGPAIRDRQRFPSRSFKESMEFYLMELEMGGVLYGTSNNPAIYMHTNVGITFDLDAIRSAYGNHPITYFESMCGIPEMVRRTYANETKNPEKTTLALYVFLDDQCRLVKTFNNTSEPDKIRIPIQLKSRFLTFAVVDTGLNPDYDWCLLGKPVLKFE